MALNNSQITLPKAILFLSLNYRVENSTFLQSIPTLLAEKGTHSVIITNTSIPSSCQNNDFVTYHSLIKDNEIEPYGNSTLKQSKSNAIKLPLILSNIKTLLYKIKKEYLWLSRIDKMSSQVLEYLGSIDYEISKTCAIEVDSLFCASKVVKVLHSDLVYCSMELSFWDIKKPILIRMFLDQLFRIKLYNVKAISIQHSERKSVFIRNTRTQKPFILLPVGVLGPANTVKSNYLRQKFNIPSHQKIVLYAGSIRSWASVLELANDAINWSNDFCLVINGWVGDVDYFKSIQEVSHHSNNIYINTAPVSWHELDQLIASADIGLAIYRDSDDNKQTTASSSNKYAIYAKSGLPIVTNLTPSTLRLFNETRWGEGVESIGGLAAAIQKIGARNGEYRQKAFEAFDKYYNLSVLGQEFIKELLS